LALCFVSGGRGNLTRADHSYKAAYGEVWETKDIRRGDCKEFGPGAWCVKVGSATDIFKLCLSKLSKRTTPLALENYFISLTKSVLSSIELCGAYIISKLLLNPLTRARLPNLPLLHVICQEGNTTTHKQEAKIHDRYCEVLTQC
jgi:hypothetical protein